MNEGKAPKDYNARSIERSISKMSETNRLDLVRYIEYKQVRRIKPNTLRNYASWVQQWDAHLQRRPFLQATQHDATAFFKHLQDLARMPYTMVQAGTYLVAFYRWLYGDKDPPRSFLAAFRLRAPEHEEVKPVTDDEMTTLLNACRTLRDRVLLVLLRDTGFRISEALAVNMGSLAFQGDEWARIELPEEAPNLKTGARTVYVTRSLPWLRALLLHHPFKGQPEAPLFVSDSPRMRGARLTPINASALLRRLCQRTGLRRVTPHLFRHTRATEAGKTGWNEAQMRLYLGWAKNSKMPAHYMHLTPEDLKGLLRRKWDGDSEPAPTPSVPSPPAPPAAAAAQLDPNAAAFAQAFGLAWGSLARSKSAMGPLPEDTTTST